MKNVGWMMDYKAFEGKQRSVTAILSHHLPRDQKIQKVYCIRQKQFQFYFSSEPDNMFWFVRMLIYEFLKLLHFGMQSLTEWMEKLHIRLKYNQIALIYTSIPTYHIVCDMNLHTKNIFYIFCRLSYWQFNSLNYGT